MLSFVEREALESDLASGKVTLCELLELFEERAAVKRATTEPVAETVRDQYAPVPKPPDLKRPDPLTATRASVLGSILQRKMFEEQGLSVFRDRAG